MIPVIQNIGLSNNRTAIMQHTCTFKLKAKQG